MINIYNKLCTYLALMVLHLFVSKKLKNKLQLIAEQVSDVNSKNTSLIPPNLKELIILVEDKRFTKHFGVDFYSINRAFVKTIFYRRIEGASTIPQQLVRIVLNEREISIRRKIQEIILSLFLRRKYSNNEIFAAYFYLYPIGNCIGIADFCKKSNLDINNLLNSDCCQIVARIKYPFVNQKNQNRYYKRVKLIENKYLLEDSKLHSLIPNLKHN